MGNEAIEIGLWHVNNELTNGDVTQVLLIGDMPPNNPTEVLQRRTSYGGDNFWSSHFGPKTDSTEQLKKIIQKNIPIYAFYVNRAAQKAFENFAQQTGGKAAPLDVNSPQGAEDLTNAVAEAVLHDVGGDEYVAIYRSKFKKGFCELDGFIEESDGADERSIPVQKNFPLPVIIMTLTFGSFSRMRKAWKASWIIKNVIEFPRCGRFKMSVPTLFFTFN